jgi:hypothetical protein
MKKNILLTTALAVVVLSGCQTTKPLYHYGSYQSNVYDHFKAQDSTVNQQIDDLEKTLATSNKHKLNVAPGIYAHLGYLYLQVGQADTGLNYLAKEKALYPESAQYVDFLLKNAKAGK